MSEHNPENLPVPDGFRFLTEAEFRACYEAKNGPTPFIYVKTERGWLEAPWAGILSNWTIAVKTDVPEAGKPEPLARLRACVANLKARLA